MEPSVGSPLAWVGFIAFILLMLALDLGAFQKNVQALTAKTALYRWFGWVGLAAAFAAGVYWKLGTETGNQFVAGYILEESLSVDNVFVMIVVFKMFRIPAELQHRALFWGILGALILRAIMIIAGTALIQQFHWLLVVFGAFLVFTGIKLFFDGNVEDDEEQAAEKDSFIIKFVKKLIPTTPELHAQHMFVKIAGKWVATPLFLVIIVIELSDVLFALDSIPAVFGVTTDPFIVFTSNIFAILGLRTLFYFVSGMIDTFHYLKYGLAVVLCFIGTKMIISPWVHIDTSISLAVLLIVLAFSIALSKIRPAKKTIKP